MNLNKLERFDLLADIILDWQRKTMPKPLSLEQQWQLDAKKEAYARYSLHHLDKIRHYIAYPYSPKNFTVLELYEFTKMLVECEELSGPICYQDLAQLLESVGFVKNAFVGPEKNIDTPKKKLEYIIGSCMNLFSHGCSGHQMNGQFLAEVRVALEFARLRQLDK